MPFMVKQYAWVLNVRMCDLPHLSFDIFTIHAGVFYARFQVYCETLILSKNVIHGCLNFQ